MFPPKSFPREPEYRDATDPPEDNHLERVFFEVAGRRQDYPSAVRFSPADDDGLRLQTLLSLHFHPEARLLPEKMRRTRQEIV